MKIFKYDKISVNLIEVVWVKAYNQMRFNLDGLLANEIAERIQFEIHEQIDSRTRNLLKREIHNKIYHL